MNKFNFKRYSLINNGFPIEFKNNEIIFTNNNNRINQIKYRGEFSAHHMNFTYKNKPAIK